MQEMGFSHILNGTGFSDSDLSLLSWLQCIPPETFSYPFEQKTLSVDVEQLDKPSLEASWFHLTGKKAMNTSVDRLFESSDVFSTSCADLQSDLEMTHISSKNKFTVPPKILEQVSPKAEEEKKISYQYSKTYSSRVLTAELLSSPILPRNDASSLDGSLRSVPVTRNLSSASNNSCDLNQPTNVNASPSSDTHGTLTANSQKSSPGGSIGRGSCYSPIQRNVSPIEQESTAYRQSPVPTTQTSVKQAASPGLTRVNTENIDGTKPHFIPVTRLEDAQAIRTAEFHPSGQLYAIGSNSKNSTHLCISEDNRSEVCFNAHCAICN
ncbi:hypothetical protein CEXT_364111 [Caerostris extrusa]|uniref:WDR47 cross-over region domain-containing protein n=1 Tax=Caerostris extrusa TaxID=172846 RepID=A0AAV4QKH7_CAEEX|nr:hypothetical protein CEXT_364111 [Caerostris extrusa]